MAPVAGSRLKSDEGFEEALGETRDPDGISAARSVGRYSGKRILKKVFGEGALRRISRVATLSRGLVARSKGSSLDLALRSKNKN